jgi:hypothetical protein
VDFVSKNSYKKTMKYLNDVSNENKINELKEKVKDAKTEKERRHIADSFYKLIRSGLDITVKNDELNENIHINRRSARSGKNKAARNIKSTYALFELLNVVKNAKKTGNPDDLRLMPKNNESQRGFDYFIKLVDNIPEIGEVELLIGVKEETGKHIQYCLTAVNTK